MSEIQTENPDEHLNYAIKLIINAYETKSQIFENELRRLNEELEQRANEYENNLRNLNKEKEYLEEKIEKEMKENKEYAQQIEIIINENKKLEKFKKSILVSINDNNTINVVKDNNTTYSSNKNLSSTPLTSNNSRQESSFKNNITSLFVSKSFNKQISIKPIEIPKLKEIYQYPQTIVRNTTNNTPVHKESRVESLIDRLNESINNRIYDDKEIVNFHIFNSLNRFNHNQPDINKIRRNQV
jgi:hypothetical protein